MEILLLIGMLVGLPFLYWLVLRLYQSDFEEEKNQNRKLLRSVPEILVICLSEAAVVRIWFEYKQDALLGLMLALLYTVLVTMTILCITDYWEKIVPNKILLVLLLVGFVELGLQCVRDVKVVMGLLPSIILGLVFCALSFGVAYILSRGSLGSGDIKLSILLGLFMTGNYVVGTVFYGCIFSALYSIVQLVRKKVTKKDEIPFVPFLYLGMIFTYLVG